jgi:hypothetical protein
LVITHTNIERATRRAARVPWLAITTLIAVAPIGRSQAETGSGPEELFRLGVQALNESRYADAASMFRLSNDMERRVETTCNLALTYERWGGHDAQALETYVACASEDATGQFRPHAEERIAALRARLRPPAPQPAPAPSVPSMPPQMTPVAVAWQVTSSTPSCFFFSGPGNLGRQDHLGNAAQWAASGPSVSLSFAGGLTFVGTRSGPQISLSRRSTHTYSGSWIVDETIVGSFTGNTFVGTYSYAECEAGNARNCPTNCTIRAQVSAVPSR